MSESPNRLARAASGANSVTRGSVRPPATCCAATGSMMAAVTPSTGSVRRRLVDRSHCFPRREVRLGGRQAGDVREVGAGASGDGLIGYAERLDHHGADRPGHRVAGQQRRRDDRGAEHQSDHDQCASSSPTRDVSQPDLQEHQVAQRHDGHDADRERKDDRKADGQRASGKTEDAFHRDP